MKTRWYPLVLLAAAVLCPSGPTQAQAPIKIRLYSSLLPGIPESYARSSGKTMPDLIAARVSYPMELGIERGETPEDLIAFGKKLNEGEIEYGALWGIEYGWLREIYPRMQVAVVCVPHGGAALNSEIRVYGKSDLKSFGDLKSKILADYKSAPLADRLYLQQKLEAEGATRETFFEDIKRYETLGEAIHAVRNREATCVVIGVQSFSRLTIGQPTLETDIQPVETSGPLAPAVIIGRPEVLERKRKGLWENVVTELTISHQSKAGKESHNFWRIERYVRPDSKFEELVKHSVAQYPIKSLLAVREVKDR